MPDDTNTTVTEATAAAANGTAATGGGEDEIAKLKREKDEAFRLLRDRDNRGRQAIAKTQQDLDDLRAEIAALKQSREQRPLATADPLAEPDAEADPIGWMKWTRRQDQEAREREARQAAAQNEMAQLNAFGLSAETAAKTSHPDYDQALDWLRTDYRKELEDSGELHEAAFAALNDPSQKKNIEAYALQNGKTDFEAALDMCAVGAFEWRRQQIVKAARRTGGNPAVKAYEMAKRRGYKGEVGGADGTQARSATQVDASLAEMERKRNLRAAEQSLSDVRGGEPHDKRVWTRPELEDLMKTNPKEYRRAIAEIANQADSGDPRDILAGIITK